MVNAKDALILAKFGLFMIAFAAVVGHLFFWVAAYHRVVGIEKWSQQAAVLIQPWWLLDKELLPAEHDHLRVKALWCFVVYVFAGLAIWFLS